MNPPPHPNGLSPEDGSRQSASTRKKVPNPALHLNRFVRFCVVGASGVVVDMTVLCLLVEPRFLGWNVPASKVIAAEVAMLNNFAWNNLWTFSNPTKPDSSQLLRHFWRFHAICGLGIAFAATLLQILHFGLGLNLYLANLVAIVAVTAWNFFMNSRFNWDNRGPGC